MGPVQHTMKLGFINHILLQGGQEDLAAGDDERKPAADHAIADVSGQRGQDEHDGLAGLGAQRVGVLFVFTWGSGTALSLGLITLSSADRSGAGLC